MQMASLRECASSNAMQRCSTVLSWLQMSQLHPQAAVPGSFPNTADLAGQEHSGSNSP